jgi:hypothetical protein
MRCDNSVAELPATPVRRLDPRCRHRHPFVTAGAALTRLAELECSMSSPTFDDSAPVEGNDTGAPTEPEEYGSLSVEDDPTGTIDPADLADTADESDEDVK